MLFGGRVFATACSFARNVIVARLIGPNDLGIAATFAMALTFLEAVSTMSPDKLLIQAEDGDSARFQGVAHLMQVVRGAVLAMIVFFTAPLAAMLFQEPDLVWAYRLLALAPIIKSLSHLDAKRLQRELKYGPEVSIHAGSQLMLLFMAWPLAAYFQNFIAALILVISSVTLQTLGSHVVARRAYQWAWELDYIRRLFDFGWPVAINGLLIFLTLQGEQFVIASGGRLFGAPYSMSDVGNFSVALAVAVAPTQILSSMSVALLLPLLARVKDDVAAFSRRFTLVHQSMVVLTGLQFVVIGVIGPVLIKVLYGNSYSLAMGLIVWISAAQAIRLVRFTPTTAAVARGDTRTAMYCNLARGSGFFLMLLIAGLHGSIVWMAIAGVAVEILAIVVSALRARSHGLAFRIVTRPALGVGAICAVTVVAARMNDGHGLWVTVLIGLAAVGVAFALSLSILPILRGELAHILFRQVSTNRCAL